MKLSEMRLCDNCGGPIMKAGQAFFFVVRVSQAMVKADAARSTLGLLQTLGGVENPGALSVAEAMSPDDEVVRVLSDEMPEAQTELLLCLECLRGKVGLFQLVEHRQIEEASGCKATEIEGNDVEAFAQAQEAEEDTCDYCKGSGCAVYAAERCPQGYTIGSGVCMRCEDPAQSRLVSRSKCSDCNGTGKVPEHLREGGVSGG